MRVPPILLGLLALLATSVIAQDATTTADDDATNTSPTPAATTTDNQTKPTATAETTTDDKATTTAKTTTDAKPTTTAKTTTDDKTTTDKTTTDDKATTTSDTSSETTSTETSSTSSSSSTSSDDDDSVPTLPGQYSYPAPTVPPTGNAPYMQPSSMPEGTVFIAVGAILGAFGAAVLIWRGVVAWLLHRNVKRAAMAQHIANDKAALMPPSAPFYKYNDQASTASLGTSLGNGASGRGVRRTTRGPIPSGTPSQTNLFFSPTAPSMSNSAGNRESRFLPSGFYAAGSGTPPLGHEHSISLTNLRPDSRGLGRPLGHSPPESPGLAPRTDSARRNLSTSSLNLNRPPSGRAPSAFLEDLLDEQQSQFPPPGTHHTWRQSQNRF
ncbi:hypothetical protein F4779DRAFT_567041 [Xylariaceae sp. FL0662B]|nr:hypothetical protein F4779DRAFT_567041 [Xylariaceae sp. FL0662B]